MPEVIGQVVDATPDSVTYAYRGDELLPLNGKGIPDLDALGIPGPDVAHYTDNRASYEAAVANITGFFADREVKVLMPDGSEETLLAPEQIEPFVEQVDQEYEETVTQLLRKITGNPDHKVPTLDPKLVYAAYVSLRAGGAVTLPTSVGNIVGAASPRGLSTMFAVKERPLEKAGVVLTTMDQIPELAKIPEGWEGYLEHLHAHGILNGSKLPRNEEHPLFKNQPEWSSDNSSQTDGTSMFVFLPGPYSDVTARILASEGRLLTASSANKSGEPNNRDLAKLDTDIKRVNFAAWDEEAVRAYILDEENESQGIMVDFLPDEDGNPKLHYIRLGFQNGPHITQTRRYLADHPELGVEQPTFSVHNTAYQANKR